ncbi:hypothetical protein ACXYMX_04300 [Sporosarcina sp. CAU 1771]
MALINKMERQTRNSRVHEVVEATYNILNVKGEKYIEVTTYGSKNREFKGKASQIMQFDREAINQLKKIIEKEYQ